MLILVREIAKRGGGGRNLPLASASCSTGDPSAARVRTVTSRVTYCFDPVECELFTSLLATLHWRTILMQTPERRYRYNCAYVFIAFSSLMSSLPMKAAAAVFVWEMCACFGVGTGQMGSYMKDGRNQHASVNIIYSAPAPNEQRVNGVYLLIFGPLFE